MRFYLICISLIQFLICHAQNDFGIEMWRDHLPYANVNQVAKVGNTCYGATPYGIYKINEEDETIEQMNTVFGLSDFLIGAINSNDYTNTLIVGYQNGNIDLIQNDRVTNMNAILMSNVVGDRAVYGIHSDKGLAYLACGFGIVVIDVAKKEVKDTYFIGMNGANMKVYDITTDANNIYAATEEGIYTADLSTPFLSDFNAWSIISSFPNHDAPCQLIHHHNGRLYTIHQNSGFSDDTLKVFDASFNELHRMSDDDFSGIESKSDDEVIIALNYNVLIQDNAFNTSETIYTYNGERNMQCNHAIWDGSHYWIGDRAYGLNRSTSNWDNKNFYIPGPLNNNCFQMSAADQNVYVASGLVTGSAWNNEYNSSGVFSFDQYDWTAHNVQTEDLIEPDSAFDFIYTSIDAKDENHALFCSFYGGLYEYQDGKVINRYTASNSSLSYSLVHANQVKVSAAQFDDDGNIWMANSFVGKPLSVVTTDGDTMAFNIGSSGINAVITDLLISKNDPHIWLAIRGKGIVVYNFNNTPLDPADDEYKFLNTTEGSGAIPSDNILCLAQDHDGEIWVGTEAGPAVFFSPGSIFNSGVDVDAQKILLLQDGSYQYLLETQTITSIAIDGANRKWFGTGAGGVFLMSEDGTEQIYAFNSSNSPMFSNVVNSLAIVGSTGELMIGTDKGIIGFRSTATEPTSNFEDVYCFPNPVRPGYNGPIAIKGLLENSDVKITDASGNLVNESTSYGGQAIWSGTDLYGNEVASGVYYIYLVSQTGQSKAVTKVLIIR